MGDGHFHISIFPYFHMTEFRRLHLYPESGILVPGLPFSNTQDIGSWVGRGFQQQLIKHASLSVFKYDELMIKAERYWNRGLC